MIGLFQTKMTTREKQQLETRDTKANKQHFNRIFPAYVKSDGHTNYRKYKLQNEPN